MKSYQIDKLTPHLLSLKKKLKKLKKKKKQQKNMRVKKNNKERI
jgi:hypothetical protein